MARAMHDAHDLDPVVESAVEDQIAPDHPRPGIVRDFWPKAPKARVAREKKLGLRLDAVEVAIGRAGIVPRDEPPDLDEVGLRSGALGAPHHRAISVLGAAPASARRAPSP
jgi:hypothetical protein